jgi:hypothetical protein
MFIFDWFSAEIDGQAVPDSGVNAWQAFGFIDIVLLITVVVAVGLALISASETETGLPVAAGAIVAGLGILSVLLILLKILDPPGDTGAVSLLLGQDVDVVRKPGVWLGLLAAIGVAYGGWQAMQEEGTLLGGEADRLRGQPGDRPGPGPEGPSTGPPPSSPPPSAPPGQTP